MNLLKKLLYKRIWIVALTVCISICNIGVFLWWNSQLSTIINTINESTKVPIKSIIIAAVTIIISMVMAYFLSLSSAWTCETLAHDLRMGYARYFTTLSINEIKNLGAGEQLSRLQNELNDISSFLRGNLFSIVDDLIRFTGTFIWMLYLSPQLTLLSNLPTLFIICYTTFTSKIIGKEALKSQQANADMNSFADTLISIFPIIRLFDAGSLIREKYKEALGKWEDASILEEKKRAKLMSLAAWMSCYPLLLLVLIGGTRVINGSLSIGTLYIFINLSGNVSGVMNNMPGRIALFRRFTANLERIQTSSGHGFL